MRLRRTLTVPPILPVTLRNCSETQANASNGSLIQPLLLDCAGVALAAFGMLNPVVAAFIHVASESAFILNSARLLPTRRNGALRLEGAVSR